MAGDDEDKHERPLTFLDTHGRSWRSFPGAPVYRLHIELQKRGYGFMLVTLATLLTFAWLLGILTAAIYDALGFLPRPDAETSFSKSSEDQQGKQGLVDINDMHLPYYDILALICTSADAHAMDEALQTWLEWTPSQPGNWSFHHLFVVCSEERDSDLVANRSDVALVVCEEKLQFPQHVPTSRAAQAYKYVSSHFKFRYLLKAEISPGIQLDCLQQEIRQIPVECPSFGLGRWYQAKTSRVWSQHEEPYGKLYHNELYKHLVGSDVYAPYMSGYATVFSADVARFLGMYGHEMPRWRNFWRIEDAAFGTYMIGVDICRLELECDPIGADGIPDAPPTQTPAPPDEVEELGKVMGFHGPFDDDVAGLGDFGNIQVSNLNQCAYSCIITPSCASFEYSPTATGQDHVKNCQLASITTLTGSTYRDFKLYIKDKDSSR